MFKESAFGSYLFTGQELIDIIGVSDPTWSTLQKTKVIEAKIHKIGAVNRKLYDWNDLQILATRYRERLPKAPKAKIKTFTNLKGGVGKTTGSSQVAMRASQLGLKTLYIDMDPQGNGSQAFGFLDNDGQPTIFECLKGEVKLEDAVYELTPTLHLIPGHLGLNQGEIWLRSKGNGQQKLKKYLEKAGSAYDLIVIDTNAALTFLSINAILAADELCIMVETALFSVSGMTEIGKVLDELHGEYEDFNPLIRIIPNKYDANKQNCAKNLEVLRDGFSDFVTKTEIRATTDFEHALDASQSVFFYKKKCNAAKDIDSLVKELLDPSYEARFYEVEA